MPKVVMVARDAAPSGCFTRLAAVLRERGWEVVLFVGEGKPLTVDLDEIRRAVSGATLVLLGMSSSPILSEPELIAREAARQAGVPYGFYGDVPGCYARARPGAWFESLAADAAFYLGIDKDDADAAREVFPSAKLFGTGNPLREEMAFPRYTRDEVRGKLGIAEDENMVLAPGLKMAAGNMASWVVIIDALASLAQYGQKFQLILAPHPGDRTPFAIDASTGAEMNFYNEIVACSPIPTRIVGKDLLTTSEMVPGADIIVEFGSSIGIEGAYQGVPVITLGFEVLFSRLAKAQGTRELEAVAQGLSEQVEASAPSLAATISRLLTLEGYASMRARQEAVCPKPTERGATLRRIADALAVL